jgi:hypothetical protein
VLSQAKSVFIDLLAESTDEVSDLVLDFSEFCFGLFSDLDYVEFRIDIT